MGMMNFLIYDTYALAFWYGSTLILKGEATSGEVSIFYINLFFFYIFDINKLNYYVYRSLFYRFLVHFSRY